MANKGVQAVEAFRQEKPYYNKKLFTSDKWFAGTNVGGIFFSDIHELSMSARESFRNSIIGRLVANFAEKLNLRT